MEEFGLDGADVPMPPNIILLKDNDIKELKVDDSKKELRSNSCKFSIRN